MIRTTTELERPDAQVVDQADAETTKTVKTVKGQSGNPALLREAREALADIRDILGTDSEEGPTDDDFRIDLSVNEDDQAQPGDGTAT
jgi:hypothetical protein